MNPIERRSAIYTLLCWRRFDSIANLALELHVSERTLQRDINLLSLSYPVETVRGCRGGVKLAEWFIPAGRCLSPTQAALLRKLRPHLAPTDQVILNSILLQFSPR